MSHFGETPLNAGSGGPSLATSTFSNESSGDLALMPYTALAYLASGNADDTTGVFQIVGPANGLPVSLLNASIAITAAALPLPSGAATAANQATEITALAAIISALDGTLTVSAASLPLPTGAATSAKQDTGNTSLASIDGKITACNTGAVTVSALPALIAGTAVIGHVIVDSSGLPTGAATSAKQDTGNTSLASIDGKITACNTGAVVIASGALNANQSVNAAQMAGTATSVNEGASDAGTQRVAIGTDDTIVTDSRWSSADTNLHSVKASAGHLVRIEVTNTGSGPVYLRIYNKASAPVPASDTPVRRYIVPGNTTGAGAVFDMGPKERYFSTGIAYDLTGAAGDTDTTAIATNQCAINVDYK